MIHFFKWLIGPLTDDKGDLSNSRVAAFFGHALALYWGVYHAGDVLDHVELALVILLVLVSPKTLEKLAMAKLGVSNDEKGKP